MNARRAGRAAGLRRAAVCDGGMPCLATCVSNAYAGYFITRNPTAGVIPDLSSVPTPTPDAECYAYTDANPHSDTNSGHLWERD